MITLNSERGFVQVENWEEVLGLPGFTTDIDHTKKKLISIIGRYLLADKVHCGLASCRTPHGRGFIVTVDGEEITNIGKDCGKTHFGVDFVTLSRSFIRDAVNAERREALTAFQLSIPNLRDYINDLRTTKRGDWIFKTLQLFRSPNNCPKKIRDTLSTMVRERHGRLMKERQETESEAAAREAMKLQSREADQDDEEARKPRRLSVLDQIALIEGLPILYPEHDLRNLLVCDVLPQLLIIESLTVAGLSDAQLRDHARWIGSKDEKIARAERAIAEGVKFLRRPNLTPFMQLLDHRSDRQAFSRLLGLLSD